MKKFWIIAGLFFLLGTALWGTDYVWTNGIGNDDWNEPGNWEEVGGFPAFNYPGQVAGDTATISSVGDTPQITAVIAVLDALTITGGTLNVAVTPFVLYITTLTINAGHLIGGDIAVSGAFDMIGGTFDAVALRVAETSTINGNITTTGNQTYYGKVNLLDSSRHTFTSSSGSITFDDIVSGTAGIIVNAAGDIKMTNEDNALQSSAATPITLNNTGTTGNVEFASSAGVPVFIEGRNDAPLAGPTANPTSGLFKVTVNSGSITVDSGGINAVGTVELRSEAVNQTGAITAGTLDVQTAGSITLTNMTNDVATIILANTNWTVGTIAFTNSRSAGLTINRVQNTLGGSVTITEHTGNITIVQSGIMAPSGGVTVTATAGNITVTNNITANDDVDTTGGNVVLDAPTGNITINGTVTTSGHGGVTVHAGGTISGGGAIIASEDVTITSTAGDITRSGAVTTDGNVVLTATTGAINASGHIESSGSVAVTATAGNITRTGAITADGAVTITAGGSITINASDNITATGHLVTMVSGETHNIAMSSTITAERVVLKAGTTDASTGTVTVNSIHTTSNGEEGEAGASIYVWAESFTATGLPGSIVPGSLPGSNGQLCLWIDVAPSATDLDSKVGDDRWHWDRRIPNLASGHLVYGRGGDAAAAALIPGSDPYEYIDSTLSDTTAVSYTTKPGFNIYIIDVSDSPSHNDNQRAVTFTVGAGGHIEVHGEYKSSGALMLHAGTGGLVLVDADIQLTGGHSFNTHGAKLTLSGSSHIRATAITLDGGIDGTTAGSDNLTLDAITAADAIAITGAVGATVSLGNITITTGAVNFSATSPVHAASYTQHAGWAVFAAAQTYTGNFAFIGTTLTVDNPMNISGTTTITNSGIFTTAAGATITSDGNFIQNGSGTSHIAVNITASGTSSISFASAIDLTGNITFTGGSITISNAINTIGNVTVNATVGNVTTHAIGQSTNYAGNVTITAADTVSANGAIYANGNVNITTTAGAITVAGNIAATGHLVTMTSGDDQHIEITGTVTSERLALIAGGDADRGDVTVHGIVTTSNGEEGNTGSDPASIYVRAEHFYANGATDGITPGDSGQLCLWVNVDPTSSMVNKVTEDRWHWELNDHNPPTPADEHLVYGVGADPGNGNIPGLGFLSNAVPGNEYRWVDASSDPTTLLAVPDNRNIYIIDITAAANHAHTVTFRVGTGYIEFRGEYRSTGSIALNARAGGIRLDAADIQLTGHNFNANGAKLTLLSSSHIRASAITLNGGIDGTAAGSDNLTLEAATAAGAITITGAVGTAALHLGDITVTTGAVNSSAPSAIHAASYTQNAGSAVFADAQTCTGNFTFTGTTLTANGAMSIGGTTTVTSSGTITTNAITSTGEVSLSATGTINTTAGNVTSTSGKVEIKATAGNITVGGISSADEVNLSASGTINTAAGTITAPSGNVEINTTAGDITIGGNITANGHLVKATTGNTHNITVNGAITADRVMLIVGANASTGIVTVSGSITTTNDGVGDPPYTGNHGDPVTFDHSEEGTGAPSIFVWAASFVATGAANSIRPGTTNGELCLYIDDADAAFISNLDSKVTGARWHWHRRGSTQPPTFTNYFYSFTEDSTHNGKIDRIRLQASNALNGIFTGFSMAVTGYEIDKTKGTGNSGYEMVPSDTYSFYVWLKERSDYDTGATLHWVIESNNSLSPASDHTKFVGVGADAHNGRGITIDTAPPRIVYALAIPDHNEIYFRISEPVQATPLSSSYGSITPNTGTASEFIISGATAYSLADLAAGLQTFAVAGIRDTAAPLLDQSLHPEDPHLHPGFNPKYPTNYNYSSYNSVPPSSTASVIPMVSGGGNTSYDDTTGAPVLAPANVSHRVSDLLISVDPGANLVSSQYFVWPLIASVEGAQNNTGVISIWDGSKALEPNDVILQILQNDVLTANPEIRFTHNAPWNSSAPSFSNTNNFTNPKTGTLIPSSPPATRFVYNLTSASDFQNGKTFDFLFKLAVSPSDLLVGRLDGAPNSNWYHRVRPFTFKVQSTNLQRGGVTILNNVINPNNGDTAYIDYRLVKGGQVTIQVFTLDGTMVDVLYRGSRDAGDYREAWNGKNRGGRTVARGMYFIRVVGPDMDEIRKVMVVR